MCGPYGHGFYIAETDTILEEYMTKNAHWEFDTDIRLIAGAELQPVTEPGVDVRGAWLYERTLAPIPYGIIPATGEVVVQRNGPQTTPVTYTRGGVTFMNMPQMTVPATDLSARAKSRIRATWDIAVPTVAELMKWIEAHYGKRGDVGEWIWAAPRLLCRSAQRRFFPAWLAADQGYINGHDDPAPHIIGEASDHRRICEALRRGGANEHWKQADNEDRKAKAELVLGIGQEN